jgi:SNF2 family DNA or RNA helicase
VTILLPVQEAALAAARRKPGFLYAMDMGLGKTLVALTEFLELVKAKEVSRLVVVCPNSFKQGWAAEIQKHGLALDVHVFESSRRNWAERWIDGGFSAPPVLILNYEAVRRKAVGQLLADFTHERKVMLVCDESINLKSPTALQTKALHKMRWRFPVRRLLSGKPTTQGANDLWGQLTMIDANAGMNYWAFRNRFCTMGGFQNSQVTGVKDPETLRALMAPVIFEAKKKDWLPGLPDKSYTTRTYALTRKLQDHYDEMEIEFLTWLDQQGKEVMAEIALTKYGKLQQIACGFIHDNEGAPDWLVPDEENPRLQLLLEIIEDIESKITIVYRHKFVGLQLERALRHLTPALIAGDMKPEQIEAEKQFFNVIPHCRVILLQIDSARYGHSLVGTPEDPCHTMILYENSYSLNTRSQIEDRIHRIGQANACLYVDFVGTDIDWRVVRALQKKEAVYQALFGRPRVSA